MVFLIYLKNFVVKADKRYKEEKEKKKKNKIVLNMGNACAQNGEKNTIYICINARICK